MPPECPPKMTANAPRMPTRAIRKCHVLVVFSIASGSPCGVEGRPTNPPTDRPTHRPTDQPIDTPLHRPTDWPINRLTDRPSDPSTDRSTDRATDRPTGPPNICHDRNPETFGNYFPALTLDPVPENNFPKMYELQQRLVIHSVDQNRRRACGEGNRDATSDN